MKTITMKKTNGEIITIPDYGVHPVRIEDHGGDNHLVYDRIHFTRELPDPAGYTIDYEQNGRIYALLKVELKKYTENGFSRYHLHWSGECKKCGASFETETSRKRKNNLPEVCSVCYGKPYEKPPMKDKQDISLSDYPESVQDEMFLALSRVVLRNEPLHTIPPIGSIVQATKAFHELIHVEPYENKQGEPRNLLYWLSRCQECGEPFVQKTGTQKLNMASRCPKHAKWGKVVQHGRHIPKNTDYQ